MALSTDEQVKTTFASFLHKSHSDLAKHWDRLVADANRAAYAEIVGHFLGLGYTRDQVDTWDRGQTYNRFIACYFLAVDGQAVADAGVSATLIDKLEKWLERLYEMGFLETDGVMQDAGAGSVVGSGDMATSRDMFVPDMDDDRRGEVTEF